MFWKWEAWVCPALVFAETVLAIPAPSNSMWTWGSALPFLQKGHWNSDADHTGHAGHLGWCWQSSGKSQPTYTGCQCSYLGLSIFLLAMLCGVLHAGLSPPGVNLLIGSFSFVWCRTASFMSLWSFTEGIQKPSRFLCVGLIPCNWLKLFVCSSWFCELVFRIPWNFPHVWLCHLWRETVFISFPIGVTSISFSCLV